MGISKNHCAFTRRQFLHATGAAAAAAAAGVMPRLASASSPPTPNVVLILADDLGYDDLGSQRPELKTPHIDSIAAAGVRFTDGYVACPVCAPSRASLLTGRYPQSFGFEFNPDTDPQPGDKPFGLPTSQKTLADRLRAAGYATGIIGKWHLG